MDNTEPAKTAADELKEIFARLYLQTCKKDFDQLKFDLDFSAAAEAAKKSKLVTSRKQFEELYHKYKRAQTQMYASNANIYDFDGQQLDIGTWRIDNGVIRRNINGEEQVACIHPVFVAAKVLDLNSGLTKVKLKYYRDGYWRELIIDKSTIAGTRKITALADNDLAVTDISARHLIAYLQDIEQLNELPQIRYASRAGWLPGGDFAPYIDGVRTDDSGILSAIHPQGDLSVWHSIATEARRTVAGKIILAASFASPLVKLFALNNFFVHIWGASGKGKTVALMLASSVWGNPALSKYTLTFYGTQVGLERIASALNNLPLVLDEFQLVKRGKKDFDAQVYMLANGVAKARGARSGGISSIDGWCNIIITSGECPIVEDSSAGGIVNRILEIEPQEDLFVDGNKVVDGLLRNYGLAGRAWIARLKQDGIIEQIKAEYQTLKAQAQGIDTTGKLAQSIALLVAVDHALTDFLGFDGPLEVDDFKSFLPSKSDVDVAQRAYEYLLGFVAANKAKFSTDGNYGEIYGKIDSGYVYIINHIAAKALEDGGFAYKAVLKWLAERDLIKRGGDGKSTIYARINGDKVRCVCLRVDNNQSVNPPF